MPCTGTVDFVGIFNYIVREQLSAPIMLEVYSQDYKDIDELAACYNMLKDMLAGTTGKVYAMKRPTPNP
jgi:L-ribulose-5-phosphate 3-epimerase UlaE